MQTQPVVRSARSLLEVAGVCVVTFAAALGLMTVLVHLGEGEPMSPLGMALVALLVGDATWVWRTGPRQAAPLVLGVCLCAFVLLELGTPRAAALVLGLAVAIVVGRLVDHRSAVAS